MLNLTSTPPQSVAYTSSGNMDNTYRVLSETNGGSFICQVAGLSSGDVLTVPPSQTKEGYTFGCWFADEDCARAWDFANEIPGDTTLYAKWIGAGLAALVTGKR